VIRKKNSPGKAPRMNGVVEYVPVRPLGVSPRQIFRVVDEEETS